jgi:predicted DsbA family dithiol-disulfide isomerase
MSAAAAEPVVRLDVWADIACPWCYLGHARLDSLLQERAAAGDPIEVRHRPFELNPGLPIDGVPMAGYLEAKLGGAQAVAAAHARLTELGREVGLAYDFAAVGKAPNSRLAHALLQTFDGDPRQRDVLRALYQAYFEQGRDITDPTALVSIASAAAGESVEECVARLSAPTNELDAVFALGRELGVSAVPTFVADAGEPDAFGLSAAAVAMQGAQGAEALSHLIDEARRRAAS